MFIYSAIILLHDPYAHIYSPGCVSAFKILDASRNVLGLIYAVCSTSFDISLLDFFCAVRLPWRVSRQITDTNFDSSLGSWLAECWDAFCKPHKMPIQENRF